MNGSARGPKARAWVEVDTAAVLENARTVARIAGTRILPVVKANAYGVGAVAVARALEALDPWGYGVATPEEGAELRAAGITRPILVLTPVGPEAFGELERLRLTPVLGDPTALGTWTARGERAFHLEIDTGMGRAGVRWREIDSVRPATDSPALEGCCTQFHSSERRDGSVREQLDRFEQAVARLPRRPALLHVANSAAALSDRRYAFDLVRPGVFLYGGVPGPGFPEPRPVASVRARVVAVRRLAQGESVGYNALWRAPRATTVATLSIGYADGLRRACGRAGEGAALLRGRRCPIIGAVMMDLTLIETADQDVAVGEIATLLGETDGARITLAELAAWTGESPRGVLTSLGPRLPRLYA